MNALMPLGMVSEIPSSSPHSFTADKVAAPECRDRLPTNEPCRDRLPTSECHGNPATAEPRTDYFVERDGMVFAGTHLLVDLWGASNLDSPEAIDAALREAAVTAGATILHGHFHHFTPNGGVSGVLVLAESHISIHTWPERDFAAIDIFMCGACDPRLAIPVLQRAFRPQRIDLGEQLRGRVV